MPEKEFTKKISKLVKSVDEVMQDVEHVIAAAKELKGEVDKIKERFLRPEDDDRLGQS